MAKRQSGSGSGVNMQDLARAGARARLEALKAEQDALLAAFPDLRGSSQPRARQRAERAEPAPRSRRGGMSAAQRKAVGERMRAYWAARRAQKATASSEQPAHSAEGSGKGKGRKRGARRR